MAKKPKTDIEKFVGNPDKIWYCPLSQMIFSKNDKNGDQMLLDVRGWGAIQHLFDDMTDAEKFQDELGEFYAQAIREKLQTLRQKD